MWENQLVQNNRLRLKEEREISHKTYTLNFLF